MQSEFIKTWNQSFKNYAVDIAKIYMVDPQGILNCLVFDSVCGSLNETYLSLVGEREIEPIENIDLKEKSRIWNKAKQLSTSEKKCILISRSIYLLEKITL